MELTIEKLVYGGDGLARSGADEERAKTVFVPYVVPGERVDAAVIEECPGFSRARLQNVLKPSPSRTQPPCPYFGSCGGCHYQHIVYEEQLRLKSEILRETLRRTARLDLDLEIKIHPSQPFHYRNRTRFHVRANPKFAIGYFRHGSHELLAVRECPISSPLINRTLTQLWNQGEKGKIPDEIDEIELFADANESLMLELYLKSTRTRQTKFITFATDLAASIPEIHGISAFSKKESRGVSPALERELLQGEEWMNYRVADESYRVSAGGFFQTNRYLLSRMIGLAVGERRGKLALDLYSGVGLFAVPLARRFERVIAVESSPISVKDLRANVPGNIKVSWQSTEAYLTSAAGTVKPEFIVVDPPRAGLGATVCAQISKLHAQEIVYVSCDPATLARDLKQLTSAGWRIAALHSIDLFPQTFHIESVTVLRRQEC
jgi:23S rRNA (uracil1939-C5)-methyltransferase